MSDGYDAEGFDRNGIHRDTGTTFSRLGYDRMGRDRGGYDIGGFDSSGFDRTGYDRNDHDSEGFDRAGFDSDGFDRQGFDSEGRDRRGYRSEECAAVPASSDLPALALRSKKPRRGKGGEIDQSNAQRATEMLSRVRKLRSWRQVPRSSWEAPEWETRYAAAVLIPSLGFEDAFGSEPMDVLRDLTRDSEPLVRAAALASTATLSCDWADENWNPNRGVTLQTLSGGLSDESAEVREAALKALLVVHHWIGADDIAEAMQSGLQHVPEDQNGIAYYWMKCLKDSAPDEEEEWSEASAYEWRTLVGGPEVDGQREYDIDPDDDPDDE